MSVIDTQSICAWVPMYRYHRIDTPITISHKYLGMWRAGVSSVVSVVTGRVLQAEASLVAFSHGLLSDGVQQVVMAELVHAVVVSVDQRNCITPQKKNKKTTAFWWKCPDARQGSVLFLGSELQDCFHSLLFFRWISKNWQMIWQIGQQPTALRLREGVSSERDYRMMWFL